MIIPGHLELFTSVLNMTFPWKVFINHNTEKLNDRNMLNNGILDFNIQIFNVLISWREYHVMGIPGCKIVRVAPFTNMDWL